MTCLVSTEIYQSSNAFSSIKMYLLCHRCMIFIRATFSGIFAHHHTIWLNNNFVYIVCWYWNFFLWHSVILLFYLNSIFSLRAKYGTDSIQNALHSCDTTESAARELAFFFPDFNVPIVQEKRKKKRLQRPLALIRPHTLAKRKDSILKAIEDSGFLIAMKKEVRLSREQAEEFYAEHKR